ncbi:hypothetical protein BDN72DRAFT_239383 [Pluteus cervinus]|uniref:Uncharacterized protein n=1 Tax=Pluteus cervinus TaxID=181527 RepID=A0ACD3BEL9_9AGAR|nr:hypothetical protein BDN72DRAFT_239383 [Pluteus cervinus]
MRAPKRHVKSESPVRIPRTDLDVEQQPQIDRLLKNVKPCSRKFSTNLTLYTDEYHILERLYYKGKNQHRSALFWRSVVEMRKYCRRLQDMDMSAQIDAFRSCFWGENTSQISKIAKGAWTHLPDAKSSLRFAGRLRDCILLLEKSQIVFQKDYESFALAIQSGSFAQLVLTLLAIASRLSSLVSELLEACQLLHITITSSMVVKEPDSISNPILNLSRTTIRDMPSVTATGNITDSIHSHGHEESATSMAHVPCNEGDSIVPLSSCPPTNLSTRKAHKDHMQRPKKPKLDEIDVIFGS